MLLEHLFSLSSIMQPVVGGEGKGGEDETILGGLLWSIKDNHHFWVGVLLLARVMVIIPAADPFASTSVKMLSVVILMLLLLFFLSSMEECIRSTIIIIFTLGKQFLGKSCWLCCVHHDRALFCCICAHYNHTALPALT